MTLPSRVADLAPYDLLLSVAETGSIGQAAQRHGVSQPAVSARLRALEATLGVGLLERSPRGTRLTTSGALVADWARHAIDAAHALDAGLAALQVQKESRLRVAASLTVAEYLLPRWLAAFRAHHPTTSVQLTSHNSTDTAADVRAGAADVGFVEGPEIPSGLDAQIVAHDRLTLVVGAGHRWARRRDVDPAQLASVPLVSREEGSGTRTYLEQQLRGSGHGPLTAPILELSSTTAIKNAVISGIGPAVLSSLAVTGELAAGTLIAVPIRQLDLRRALRAIWPAHQRLDGPARDLVRTAAAHRPTTSP
ncbi:MAG: LysR family transcriptional regulator [Pseudonocardia sp.]|nr:LysR family transcriptional regulator [Pseudonocardia sp.]